MDSSIGFHLSQANPTPCFAIENNSELPMCPQKGCFLFQAVDVDTGPWGEVTYSIYGPGSDLYVDPTSGRAWEAEGGWGLWHS